MNAKNQTLTPPDTIYLNPFYDTPNGPVVVEIPPADADHVIVGSFDALAKIPLLRLPVLLIHGTADAEVPYTMSERLFAAAPGPKWLTLVPGGGHEDSADIGGALYARDVVAFTRLNLRRP